MAITREIYYTTDNTQDISLWTKVTEPEANLSKVISSLAGGTYYVRTRTTDGTNYSEYTVEDSVVVAAGFNIDDTTNMFVNIDPHDTANRTVDANGKITSISGAGKTFNVPSGGTAPALLAGAVNTRDVIDFNGVDNKLMSAAYNITTDAEIFYIFKLVLDQKATQSPIIWKASDFTLQYKDDTNVFNGNNAPNTSLAAVTAAYVCVYFHKQGGVWKMKVSDNANISQDNAYTTTNNINDVYLFSAHVAGYETKGQLALYRGYNRLLTAEERTAVRDGLATRYGITITTI